MNSEPGYRKMVNISIHLPSLTLSGLIILYFKNIKFISSSNISFKPILLIVYSNFGPYIYIRMNTISQPTQGQNFLANKHTPRDMKIIVNVIAVLLQWCVVVAVLVFFFHFISSISSISLLKLIHDTGDCDTLCSDHVLEEKVLFLFGNYFTMI